MIRIALVGCGGMGNWHAQQFQKIPDVKVVALCDVIPDRTKTYKDKYFPDAATYESFDVMLRDSSLKLDAIDMVTPHAVHYPHAKAALEHGLHVLTDKPMVTSSEHAYDLWRTVNKTKKLLGITFQSPYTPEFTYLAQQRDKGALGKVQMIGGWLSQSWLTGTKGTWRQQPEISGGGQMYDSGSHLLNAMMWLMNEPVVEVGCFYDKCGSPVDINGVAIARFQNGALGHVSIGGACPAFRTEIQIQTDTMLIVTDQYGGKLEMNGKDGKRIYPHIVQDLNPVGAAGTPHQNFVNAILGKEPLAAPVRYGVLLSALMDALYESAKSQSIVKVKPVPASI